MTPVPLILSGIVFVLAIAVAAWVVRRRTGSFPGTNFWLVAGGAFVGLALLTVVSTRLPSPAQTVLALFGTIGLVSLAGFRLAIAHRRGELDIRLLAIVVLGALTVALSVLNATRR